MVSAIPSRRRCQTRGMEQLTAFRASPPIVDLATSVQNVAEEIMAMINAPPTTQSSGSCGNVDCWPYRKTKAAARRSEEHTSELQSLTNLVCRLLLEKKNKRL